MCPLNELAFYQCEVTLIRYGNTAILKSTLSDINLDTPVFLRLVFQMFQ